VVNICTSRPDNSKRKVDKNEANSLSQNHAPSPALWPKETGRRNLSLNLQYKKGQVLIRKRERKRERGKLVRKEKKNADRTECN
jgi:hypothetical protein